MSFIDHLWAVFPHLIKGAIITLRITALAVFFGLIIGVFLGLGRIAKADARASLFEKFATFSWKAFSTAYVDFIRGTPLLIQIFIIYFGLPQLIREITGNPFRIDALTAGVLASSINSGAYVAEIVRAGVQSIERGQMEAARSLGLNKWHAMRYIILPQALKRIIPPLGNEFIAMLKDTSLLAVIGVVELTRAGQLYTAVNYQPFPVYIGIAIIYFIMTFTISRLVDYTERRLGVSDRRD